MPDKTQTQTISIRKMPSAVWWDMRTIAAEKRISVQDLVVQVLKAYIKTTVPTDD